MSSEEEFYCDVCGDQSFDSQYHLNRHLAGKIHREKVDSIIEENEEQLEASDSELASSQARRSQLVAENETLERRIDELVEEIETNERLVSEQKMQIEAQTAEISKLQPKYDELQTLNALKAQAVKDIEASRAELSALTAQKSETQMQLDELTATIQKSAALAPELEQEARDEIIRELVREEEQKFAQKKQARISLDLLYHRGEISFDEYFSRKQELEE